MGSKNAKLTEIAQTVTVEFYSIGSAQNQHIVNENVRKTQYQLVFFISH